MIDINNRINLIKGDCLQVMQDIPDMSIDLILADLPFGTTKNKWDTIIPFKPLWFQYERIIKDHGAILLFSQQPFTSKLVMSNLALFRYEIIMHKSRATGFLNANRIPLKAHENLEVFYKHLPTYNPQFTYSTPYKAHSSSTSSNYGDFHVFNTDNTDGRRYPRSVIYSNTSKKGKQHPTEKPLDFLQNMIKQYSNPNDIVLDNVMGTGSTGIAAVMNGRKFIGIEQEQNYFDIAVKRITETANEQMER